MANQDGLTLIGGRALKPEPLARTLTTMEVVNKCKPYPAIVQDAVIAYLKTTEYALTSYTLHVILFKAIQKMNGNA